MNPIPKTYLLLCLLAVVQIGEVIHGLSHEHSYCFLHNQIEENNHIGKTKIPSTATATVSSCDPAPNSDEHVACKVLSGLQKSATIASCCSLDQNELVRMHAKGSLQGFQSPPLIQSPKNSPPIKFA